MKRLTTALFSLSLVLVAVSLSFAAAEGSTAKTSVIKGLASMPLAFTENQGQWDERVLFRANAGGATMWFAKDGAYYQFTRRIPMTDETPVIASDRRERGNLPHSPNVTLSGVEGRPDQPDSIETMMIKADFVGSNPYPRVVGEGLLEYKCNYFLGNDPAKWRTNIPNYSAVVYEDIYPGIDLKYYGNGKQMEYDFIVSPGVDPSQIEVKYEGAKSVSVNAAGELVVETDWGEVIEQRPVVYQMSGGDRVSLAGEYVLKGDKAFGFALPDGYNANLPLVIDPTLAYSTYLGGSGSDCAVGIAVDDSGNAFITGTTYSSNFPTENPLQSILGGGADVFVTSLNSGGTGIIYSTYLGGTEYDHSFVLEVDGNGSVFIVGTTHSLDFPTQNAFQPVYGGDGDAFAAKLNGEGNQLVYSTFLGGSDLDNGWSYSIDVDENGNLCITGTTMSPDFPTQNALQVGLAGSLDAFVTKLNSTGSDLIFSTYLGGTEGEVSGGTAVDDSGNVFVAGNTFSPDFPTQNPFQETNGGQSDVYVVKLNGSGSTILYSTYLGGSNNDGDARIAVAGDGTVYLTGYTESSDFPTQNAFQSALAGAFDAFIAKVNSVGSGLIFSTYLGGSSWDRCTGIAVDSSSNVYVTGATQSLDFPTENAFQDFFAGGNDWWYGDAFVAKMNAEGDNLVYSTYLGGSLDDAGRAITVDASGAAYVTGLTSSTDFPTENPYQTDQGGDDVFVTKLTEGNENQRPIASIDDISPNPAVQGQSVLFDGSSSDGDGTVVDWWWESNIDGRFGYAEDCSYSGLFVGTHTITFKVQDNDGDWSLDDTELLEVQSDNDCPLAFIHIAPVIEWEGETVYFSGECYDDDGIVVGYYWHSSIIGQISSEQSFQKSNLPPGNHTITFKVYDNDGCWSDEDSELLDVVAPSDPYLGFNPDRDGWSFGNTSAMMWEDWNSSCMTWELCESCDPTRCYPSWDIYSSVFGNGRKQWVRWIRVKGCFEGACAGFVLTSLLFFDGLITLEPFEVLYDVPYDYVLENHDVRHTIISYWLTQSRKEHLTYRNGARHKTPSETLQDCIDMFATGPGQHRYLAMSNCDDGSSHAVLPFKVDINPLDPDQYYIRVYDPNCPGCQDPIYGPCVSVRVSDDSWTFSHGSYGSGDGPLGGLYLMDPVATYADDLPSRGSDDTELQYFELYLSLECDIILQDSVGGQIGRIGDSTILTIGDGMPIVLIDGPASPVGYFLPNQSWFAQVSNILDSTLWLQIDTDSALISIEYDILADTQMCIFSYPGDERSVSIANHIKTSPPTLIETVEVYPDSEVYVSMSAISSVFQDSMRCVILPDSGLRVDNFGATATYNLRIEIAGAAWDTVFYSEELTMDSNSSQTIITDWRLFGDSVLLLVDQGMNGVYEDTVLYENIGEQTYVCGDVDGSGGNPNVADLTYFVDYLFFDGPPPPVLEAANVDGEGGINVVDLIYLVDYIFFEGPAPVCGPIE